MTKHVVTATWDDAPHLGEEAKGELLREIPPHLREARSKGVPSMGAGAIYPVPESEIVCEPRDIPKHWPRVYGFDVGWNRTAAVWGAIDRESQTVYLYSEHYRGQAEPAVHAESVRARGQWIPGVIDPAARGRGQRDGKQLLTDYIDLGLRLSPAVNAVEAGLYAVWERLSGSRIKVFNTLTNWLDEYRLYRRDENGKIIKERDHLMDATRYLIVSGLDVATVEPVDTPHRGPRAQGEGGWLGT
jgi:hypothetical protein